MRYAQTPIVVTFLLAAMAGGAARVLAVEWLVTDQGEYCPGDQAWIALARGDRFPEATDAIVTREAVEVADAAGGTSMEFHPLAVHGDVMSTRAAFAAPGVHVLGFQRSELQENGVLRVCSAKTAVRVGASGNTATGSLSTSGHALELVPERDPGDWNVGGTASFFLLLGGLPWRGVAVQHIRDGDETYATREPLTTDESGQVRFVLDKPGYYCVSAFLERPTERLGKAQTEQLEATFTFRVHGSADVTPSLLALRCRIGELSPEGVLAFRMTRRALEELGLSAAATALEVTAWGPEGSSASMSAGAAAAMGGERTEIEFQNAPTMRDAQVIVTDASTHWRAVCSLRDAALNASDAGDMNAPLKGKDLVLWYATRSDEELIDVLLIPPAPGPRLQDSPMLTQAAIGNGD